MKTMMTASKRTQWIAGTVAVLASLLTVGGPLVLAEHYAQTGAGGDASGYYAVAQARRCACPAGGNSRTAGAAARRNVEHSRDGLAA